MNYLFDSDHMSVLQRPTGAEFIRLQRQILAHSSDRVFVSVVSFQEQAGGCINFVNQARTATDLLRAYSLMRTVLATYQTATVVDYDAAALTIADSLRRQYPRVGRMDLRIAAIALARGMTLLTRNRSDFGQIANLAIEDWTA